MVPRNDSTTQFEGGSFATSINDEGDTMTNATNVETKHLKLGDVSYAYRELRPAKSPNSCAR